MSDAMVNRIRGASIPPRLDALYALPLMSCSTSNPSHIKLSQMLHSPGWQMTAYS